MQMLARRAIYWKREALAVGFVVEPRILELAEKLALRYLKKQVRDPVLREKLTPRYPMGCKRILPTNDYYAALCRENVDVVTDGIVEVRAHSIATKDGTEREVDAIVCATGFEAAEAVAPFEVRGRGGIELNEAWKNGIEAYLGTAVNGFPNMFMIIGPNTGLGHSSMVFMIESQVAYIVDAIKTMRRKQLTSVEIHAGAQSKYNARLQERLAKTVWAADCDSWYKSKSGKNTTLWPGFTFEFKWRLRKFDADAYECREARSERAQTWPKERIDATIAPN
jgi:cyclohexanone monooxygenase